MPARRPASRRPPGSRASGAPRPAERAPEREVGRARGTGLLDLQRLAGNRAAGGLVRSGAAAPPTGRGVLESPGRRLDPAIRAEMELRFGHDFGDVRVHTDAEADSAARDLDARAYTAGADIVFEGGAYAPATVRGRRLLAHELAHVVQQARGRGQHQVLRGHAPLEGEAERAAAAVSAGRAAPVSFGAPPGIAQRQPAGRTGDPTAEELSEAALKRGPSKKAQKQFKQAVRQAEKLEKSSTPGRVDIPTPTKHRGVKPVRDADFVKEATQHRVARREAGLPEAFLGIDSEIDPLDVAMEGSQTLDTNVVVAGSATKGGGKVWVTSVTLPWSLTTAGFLNVELIDPKLLKPTDEHERGHREIAERLRDRLATLLRAELEGALPTAATPLAVKGKHWEQKGINVIIAQIQRIIDRYLDWFDALGDSADRAWDTQEQQALSRIAAGRLTTRQPTAPTLGDEE